MASQLKASGRVGRDRPNPDTKTGRLFAALLSGEWIDPVPIVGKTQWFYAIDYLTDNYGMEICRQGRSFKLIGEWIGDRLVPLVDMTGDTSNAVSNISR